MLIGVELPVTEENVKNIGAIDLMAAHDLFLKYSQDTGTEEMIKQYQICRNEIIRRLVGKLS